MPKLKSYRAEATETRTDSYSFVVHATSKAEALAIAQSTMTTDKEIIDSSIGWDVWSVDEITEEVFDEDS
jgi:hypothetical protein